MGRPLCRPESYLVTIDRAGVDDFLIWRQTPRLAGQYACRLNDGRPDFRHGPFRTDRIQQPEPGNPSRKPPAPSHRRSPKPRLLSKSPVRRRKRHLPAYRISQTELSAFHRSPGAFCRCLCSIRGREVEHLHTLQESLHVREGLKLRRPHSILDSLARYNSLLCINII